MATPEELEETLRGDLRGITDEIRRQDLWDELYRALTNRRWYRAGVDGAHVALSWKRTEELINELRAEHGLPPVELAQTGGEGTLDETVARMLDRLGWTSQPEDTDQHDPDHLDSPEDQPITPPQDTLRDAHEEAERNRRREVRLPRDG
jgi:hypothetical protein